MNRISEIPEHFDLGQLFEQATQSRSAAVLSSTHFERTALTLADQAAALIDRYPNDEHAPSCCFLRFSPGAARVVRIGIQGSREFLSCPSGGWLLEAGTGSEPSYWIPQAPTLRTFDPHARVLSEEAAKIVGMRASPEELAVELQVPEGKHLDWVVWQLPAAGGMRDELKHLLTLERQPTYTWSSQAACRSPADLFAYLIHGHVYQNAYAWPRKWKFCCELDAYELYIRLHGLERATGKKLYSFLKRQVLFSVIARQAQDGGWYHGEWIDLCECHYRFHAGALLLLENAYREWPDPIVHGALSKGAAFVASRIDQTDLGPWFLHDSLEASPELMDEMPRMFAKALPGQVGRGAWKPSTFLGKSPTNKMVFNTHVDTTVALDRYRAVSGDAQFEALVAAARDTALRLLALRPAERLYRFVYRLVDLTLRPAAQAQQLPLPVRALKRLTWQYLIPRLYKLKWAFPRLVMPSGFIDRHLSPLHFDAKYHAVNILDLVRLWRRFPDAELGPVIDAAIGFVVGNNQRVLRWWAEDKPRKFAIVVFGEALYQLCMLKPDISYRRHLAHTLVLIEDLKLGLPPSLLGGNSEILADSEQVPCPSPRAAALRVVNLSSAGHKEILLANPTDREIVLAWESAPQFHLTWTMPDKGAAKTEQGQPIVPPRGWLRGQG